MLPLRHFLLQSTSVISLFRSASSLPSSCYFHLFASLVNSSLLPFIHFFNSLLFLSHFFLFPTSPCNFPLPDSLLTPLSLQIPHKHFLPHPYLPTSLLPPFLLTLSSLLSLSLSSLSTLLLFYCIFLQFFPSSPFMLAFLYSLSNTRLTSSCYTSSFRHLSFPPFLSYFLLLQSCQLKHLPSLASSLSPSTIIYSLPPPHLSTFRCLLLIVRNFTSFFFPSLFSHS